MTMIDAGRMDYNQLSHGFIEVLNALEVRAAKNERQVVEAFGGSYRMTSVRDIASKLKFDLVLDDGAYKLEVPRIVDGKRTFEHVPLDEAIDLYLDPERNPEAEIRRWRDAQAVARQRLDVEAAQRLERADDWQRLPPAARAAHRLASKVVTPMGEVLRELAVLIEQEAKSASEAPADWMKGSGQ